MGESKEQPIEVSEDDLEQRIKRRAIKLLKEVSYSLPEYDRAKVSHYDPKVADKAARC